MSQRLTQILELARRLPAMVEALEDAALIDPDAATGLKKLARLTLEGDPDNTAWLPGLGPPDIEFIRMCDAAYFEILDELRAQAMMAAPALPEQPKPLRPEFLETVLEQAADTLAKAQETLNQSKAYLADARAEKLPADAPRRQWLQPAHESGVRFFTRDQPPGD